MESNWSAIWQNFLYQKKIERYDDDLIAAGKRWLKPTTRELSKNVATSSCGFSLQELPPPQTVFDHNLRINFAWKAMTMKVLMFSSGWILQPTCFGKARWDQAVNAAVAGYEETASTTLFLNKTPSGARCCSCIQNQSSPAARFQCFFLLHMSCAQSPIAISTLFVKVSTNPPDLRFQCTLKSRCSISWNFRLLSFPFHTDL